jgi:DNA end-binding protein Ku
MRSIWTGALSFGLVNIPVRLYSATASTGLSFKLLDSASHEPISYQKVARDGHEVAYEDIVKGYEFRRGEYVILTDEDFEHANRRRTKTIEIVSFTDAAQIAPYYYEKPYYLEPDKGADKPYALLRAALLQAERVAVATFVLRNREHLAAVYALGDVLVLNQLRFANEVRDADELNLPAASLAEAREVKMALALIDQLTEDYDPAAYRDSYTEELETIITAKVAGKAPEVVGGPAPKPTDVHDIMAMLKESLERSRAEKRSAKTGGEAAKNGSGDDEADLPKPKPRSGTATKTATAKKATAAKGKATPRRTAASDGDAPAKPRRSRAKPSA